MSSVDAPTRPTRFRIGPIEVDRLTSGGALDAIEALVRAGRGGAVFTPNVDHVVLADDDPAFAAAYRAADLSLADGMPLLWAARLLGDALPERVAGSDLVVPLVARAAERGWRVYLLGGDEGVAPEAARRLSARFPALRVAGVDAPRVSVDGGGDESERALQRIEAARPDVLLVAFGAPKQERWIHRHRARLGPAVAVGVGASLDFVAGRIPRAPDWMRRRGLEWFWRLAREPRRLWRRYLLKDPRFALIVLREAGARRAAR